MNHDLTTALTAYLECALWSSTNYGPDGDIGDSFYSEGFEPDDIAPESVKAARSELADFLQDCADSGLSTDEDATDEMMGHDFWLTRNGHGAGFWDRGYPGTDGDTLTALCKPYGSSDACMGDDGLIYLS